MEEKEGQSPTVNPSSLGPNPSSAPRTRAEDLPSARDLGEIIRAAQPEGSELTQSTAPSSGFEDGGKEAPLRVIPEEEKKREVDLNVLFPGKNYDLNRPFLMRRQRSFSTNSGRNKRDIERFVKTLIWRSK
jgi:hypothetical protein